MHDHRLILSISLSKTANLVVFRSLHLMISVRLAILLWLSFIQFGVVLSSDIEKLGIIQSHCSTAFGTTYKGIQKEQIHNPRLTRHNINAKQRVKRPRIPEAKVELV